MKTLGKVLVAGAALVAGSAAWKKWGPKAGSGAVAVDATVKGPVKVDVTPVLPKEAADLLTKMAAVPTAVPQVADVFRNLQQQGIFALPGNAPPQVPGVTLAPATDAAKQALSVLPEPLLNQAEAVLGQFQNVNWVKATPGPGKG